MTRSNKSLISLLCSATVALAFSGVAAAQDSSHPSTMHKMGAQHSDMMDAHGEAMGMHKMPATVTAVNAKTGVVEVTAGGMALKVHFPPDSMSTLKAGDKITLHMGYDKP